MGSSRLPSFLTRLRPDPFLLMIVSAVIAASLLPVRGALVHPASILTDVAIALLFFLHGAKLSRQAIAGGITAWRIHLAVLLTTFVVFPILGLGIRALTDTVLDPAIGAGILLLCLMPSTVQSSIAFTSVARGNVPAAVCSAAASNILGVVVTPLLVALLFAKTNGGISLDGAIKIALQLLLPFILGHLSRPVMEPFLNRYRNLLSRFDRGVIILVVYTAFSAAVVEGLWHRYSWGDLGWTLAIDAALLAVVLTLTTWGSRALGFSKPDEITIVFCGSKKSLASGVPIAGALFPAAVVGPMILPLMLFHQIQLMTCAWLAQRYAARPKD